MTTQKNAGVRTVYFFNQLSDEAKEKAREWFREGNDGPFLQSHMINMLEEKLDERKIKYNTDSIDVRYSLSHSQGDGFMFIGELEWGKYTVYITHLDRNYCHKNTARIEMQESDNLGFHVENEKDEKEFETLYGSICDEMERIGYDEIEYQNSAEYIDEAMEANGYTFTADGKRLDADKEDHTCTMWVGGRCATCGAEA